MDVISLGIGDPDMPTPELVPDALAVAAHDPGTHQYPSNRGRAELRDAFARFYDRRFGVKLDTDTEIIPALGAKECVFNVNLAFLDPGTCALAADPGYPVYTGGPLLTGADAVLMPLVPELRLRAGPGRHRGRGCRARPADVPELPEQPHRRRGARRVLRAGCRVRAGERHPGRARRLVHRDHVRRLRRAELPGDAGRQGGRRRDLLAVQGLQHDRLADRRRSLATPRRARPTGAQDEHRLRDVRGRPAGRRGRARRRRPHTEGDERCLPAPP